jgi:hypothetical protein
MTKKRPWPCKIGPDGVKPCWALNETLQEPGGRGTRAQGITLNTMIDMKTMAFNRNLIVLKSGQHSKKGLVMNLCPFCGGELIEGASTELRKRSAA